VLVAFDTFTLVPMIFAACRWLSDGA